MSIFWQVDRQWPVTMTPLSIEAHEKVDALKDELVMQGGWGAIVLDYGRSQSNIHQFYE